MNPLIIYLISEDFNKYVKGDLVVCEITSPKKADFTDEGKFFKVIRLLRTP